MATDFSGLKLKIFPKLSCLGLETNLLIDNYKDLDNIPEWIKINYPQIMIQSLNYIINSNTP